MKRDANSIANLIVFAMDQGHDEEIIIALYQELVEHLNNAIKERDLILSSLPLLINFIGAEALLEEIGAERVGKWFMGLGSM